jgi:hypothetical protein
MEQGLSSPDGGQVVGGRGRERRHAVEEALEELDIPISGP